MKRNLFLLFSVLTFYNNAFAQMNNFWVLGYNYTGIANPFDDVFTMDFRNSQITYTDYQNTAFGMSDCNASICDSSGNLLFFSNGLSIMNALGDTMINGDSLTPGTTFYFGNAWLDGVEIPEAAIALPDPGNPHKYYLIHGSEYTAQWINAEFCDTLYYSNIDMQQDSGRGVVTQKNQHLWVGDLTASELVTLGSLTACKHANGRDWWIVAHKDSSNIFMTFLLTPSGFQGPFTQAIGPVINTFMGQAVFSPDGSKYAFYCPAIYKKVHLFNFDRCTGLFSHHQSTLNLPDTTYGSVGIAFSPNSRFLYTSSFSEINQFDTWAQFAFSTKTLVAVSDSFPCPFWVSFYLMQLASDGRIYICSPNGVACMTVINFPDSMGVACQTIPHGISLPFYNGYSIPYYPNFYLGSVTGSTCDSLTGIKNNTSTYSYFNLKPNPNNGDFTVNYQLPPNESGILEIFNSLGEVVLKEVLSQWSSSHKIEMLNTPVGIYLCRVSSGLSATTSKFVVRQ